MKKVNSMYVSLFIISGLFFIDSTIAQEKPEIQVEIHGELEYEFSSSTAEDIEPGFQIDKFVIQPKIKYGDYIRMSAQWYARPKGNSYLNEFHATFINLPFNTWFDTGLFERAIKDHHSRKTETYSLYGNTFYRDDTYGVSFGTWQKKYKAPAFYWIVSLTEGYKVGHKQPAEQVSKYDDTNSDKVAQDDLNDMNDLKFPEFGFNLGGNPQFGNIKLDLMGFLYMDKLNDSEKSNFQTYAPNAVLDGNDRYRAGAQVNTQISGARIFAAFLAANDAELNRTSYVAEASYKYKFQGRNIFTAIEPVISYSGYNIDTTPSFAVPESWDRTQLIIAGIIDVLDKTKIKVEYVINDETTGNGAIDNNEFLVQFELKF